ncbi:hypothetical protein [Nocardia sp. NPDC046763]|uniref:hypothetical protein n=1 Tax=Nocardia sp. NPDC046763 TaxID=3155256 RepID=UPI0033DDD50C
MDREAYLLHQVHPAKLATDITAGIASMGLMWQRRVATALVVAHVPAVLASALLVRRDLTSLRRTRRGRYVLAHMPPAASSAGMSSHQPWYSRAWFRRFRPLRRSPVVLRPLDQNTQPLH